MTMYRQSNDSSNPLYHVYRNAPLGQEEKPIIAYAGRFENGVDESTYDSIEIHAPKCGYIKLGNASDKKQMLEAKTVFLTFDDGPDEEEGKYTSQILTTLTNENVQATFFLIGARMQHNSTNKSTTMDIVLSGSTIGSHGYSWYDVKGPGNDGHIFLGEAWDVYEVASGPVAEVKQAEKALRSVVSTGKITHATEYIAAPQHIKNYIDELAAKSSGIMRSPALKTPDPSFSWIYSTATSSDNLRVPVEFHDRVGVDTLDWQLQEEVDAGTNITIAVSNLVRRVMTGYDFDLPIDRRSMKWKTLAKKIWYGETSRVSNGETILMHSRLEVTATALPYLILELKSKGFKDFGVIIHSDLKDLYFPRNRREGPQ